MIRLLPVLLLAATFGCNGGDAAVFSSVNEISVRHISASGLTQTTLTGSDRSEAIRCLYTTSEVASDQGRELLQSTYLIEVSDSHGDRSFELYTAAMSGTRGLRKVDRELIALVVSGINECHY